MKKVASKVITETTKSYGISNNEYIGSRIAEWNHWTKSKAWNP